MNSIHGRDNFCQEANVQDRVIKVIQPSIESQEVMLEALNILEQTLRAVVDHPTYTDKIDETARQLSAASEARAFIKSLKGDV